MAENEIITQDESIIEDSEDYISAIQQLKSTTVSKAEYDKLKEEKTKLVQALVEGGQMPAGEELPSKRTPSEIQKDLFNSDKELSNLDYVKTALELRETLLEKGERDPFVPCGDKVTLNATHYETAERVAEVLKECVDFANGDSGIFTAELQRRTKDSMPRYGKR